MRDVFLRCTLLASSRPTSGPPTEENDNYNEAEEFIGDRGCWMRRPVAAHWQLECHGYVYQYTRTGSLLPWNPITFSAARAEKTENNPAVFYRKRIGRTALAGWQIFEHGKRLAECANYNLVGRNCQSGVIELAAIIINEEDQDTHFRGEGGFPTRLAEYVMYAGATAAVAALAYRFFPKEGPSISIRHGDSDYTTRNSWPFLWEGVKDSWMQHNGTGRNTQQWQRITHMPAQSMSVTETLHQVCMADLLPHTLKGLVGPAAAVVGVGVLVWLYLVNHPELLEHLSKGWDQLLVHLGEA